MADLAVNPEAPTEDMIGGVVSVPEGGVGGVVVAVVATVPVVVVLIVDVGVGIGVITGAGEIIPAGVFVIRGGVEVARVPKEVVAV